MCDVSEIQREISPDVERQALLRLIADCRIKIEELEAARAFNDRIISGQRQVGGFKPTWKQSIEHQFLFPKGRKYDNRRGMAVKDDEAEASGKGSTILGQRWIKGRIALELMLREADNKAILKTIKKCRDLEKEAVEELLSLEAGIAEGPAGQ